MVSVSAISLKGMREQNEDKHQITLNADNKDPNMKDINYFAIFDGHGGQEVSRYVQKNISQYFTNKQLAYPLDKKYVFGVFDKIQNELKTMKWAATTGSTALIVINYKLNGCDYLATINAGDCRCILCRDNFAMPLTKDHKPHWPEEKHRIEQLGGVITFDQYDWRIQGLSVSRSFGDVDAAPFLSHRPDVFRYQLDRNDKFFVIACDGLWDVLSNQDVVNFVLLNCYDATTNNKINTNINIAKRLAEWALRKGSTDNITVVVVFLK